MNAATDATKTPSAMRRDTCTPQRRRRPSGQSSPLRQSVPCGERGNFGEIGGGLRPNLAVAVDDVLQRGQLPEAHGAPSMQLLGGDADLGAEPELLTVDEAGRRVDQHGGRV